jgi:hypothetical protein
MKLSLIAVLACFTSLAHAHQYIQCSSIDPQSSDRAVISLNGVKSTLFMTSGIDDPEEVRVLKSISLLRVEGDKTLFQAKNDESIETVILPTAIIGKSVNHFALTLNLSSIDGSYKISEEMSCFSSVYND